MKLLLKNILILLFLMPNNNYLAFGVKYNTIKCKASLDNIHNSHHTQGTVNVVSRIDCTGTVQIISANTILINKTTTEINASPKTVYNTNKLRNNSALLCKKGNIYEASVIAVAIFPLKYSPPIGIFASPSKHFTAYKC